MPRRINLLPKGERVRTATNVPALGLLAGALIVIFALGLSFYLLSSERSNLQKDVAELEDIRADKELQVAALDEYKDMANRAGQMEEIVRAAYAGRTPVAQVLSDLSRVLPENVWITSFSLTAGDPQAASETAPGGFASGTGTLSLQGNTYSFPDVALLLVRLKLMSSLTGVTLASAGDPFGTVDPKKKIRGFSLSATVRNTQPADKQLPLTKVEVEGL